MPNSTVSPDVRAAAELELRRRERERLAAAPSGPRYTFADLKIRTKGDENSEPQLVTLVPNAVQCIYLDELCPGWRTGDMDIRGKRELLLKARQFGFTTLIAAVLFLKTLNTPHTQSVILADELKKTANLFRIIKRFYDNLPPDKKPRAQYASKYEYYWPDIDCGFFVGTAEAKEFGRSATINHVLGSEVAFWPDAESLLAGLLQAVPRSGNIFLETTANGVGNWYHNEYQDAKRGKSVFTPRFFPWFAHTEYRVSPKDVPADMLAGLTVEEAKEEARLKAQFGIDDEQIIWRRGKVLETKRKFPQEYPATDEEAFLTSGAPYFDAKQLLKLYQDILTDATGSHTPLDVIVPGIFNRLRALYSDGSLTVWKLPEAGRWYVIAADTAEGISRDGRHDFDSADVLDGQTWEQVAHLHCQISTFEFGNALAELGRWYNRALIGVEKNNTGGAVLSALVHEAAYPKQDAGQRHGLYYHITIDKEGKANEAAEPGWLTTLKSKYTALDGLAESLAEDALILHGLLTVSELRTFSKLPGNKVGGEKGSHDDAVISLSIGDALLKLPRSASTSGRTPSSGLFARAGSRKDETMR